MHIYTRHTHTGRRAQEASEHMHTKSHHFIIFVLPSDKLDNLTDGSLNALIPPAPSFSLVTGRLETFHLLGARVLLCDSLHISNSRNESNFMREPYTISSNFTIYPRTSLFSLPIHIRLILLTRRTTADVNMAPIVSCPPNCRQTLVSQKLGMLCVTRLSRCLPFMCWELMINAFQS